MSNVIQTTTQFEPISVSFTVQRKGLSKAGSTKTALPTYTFVVYNADGTLVSPAPTFIGSYFIPIYDSSDPDYTTVRFQASLNGVNAKNYPVQLEWDFGDGTKVSTYSESTANINNAPKTGSCSVASTGWDEATKVVTYTATGHNLRIGNSVTISDISPIDYNGAFIVDSVPTLDTFTVSGFKFNPGPSRTNGSFKSLTYEPIYHRFQYDTSGTTINTSSRLPVTLSMIDSVGRKIVVSKMVYPRVGLGDTVIV